MNSETNNETNLLRTQNYPHKSWAEKYDQNNKIKLSELHVNSSWEELFDQEQNKEYWDRIENILTKCLKVNVYPYPDLVFNAFNATSLDDIKVVILGQDPYHKNEMYKGKIIPQAMGLSFSIPVNVPIPSSLKNIYKNQKKFGHITTENQGHGNLIGWAYQGCMMLNTSLTVQHGHPYSHVKFWEPFTDEVIKFISDKCNNVMFVLWGAPALKKLHLIDHNKHKTSISSHPSGLSCNNRLRQYDSFMNTDHFGTINKYLKKHGKTEIVWGY